MSVFSWRRDWFVQFPRWGWRLYLPLHCWPLQRSHSEGHRGWSAQEKGWAATFHHNAECYCTHIMTQVHTHASAHKKTLTHTQNLHYYSVCDFIMTLQIALLPASCGCSHSCCSSCCYWHSCYYAAGSTAPAAKHAVRYKYSNSSLKAKTVSQLQWN